MSTTPRPGSLESNNLIFKSVHQLLGVTLSWHPIVSKGTTNSLFSAQLAEQKLILRINAERDLAFGVDREVEDHILSLIQGYSWAPKVIKNNRQAGWCLMHDHGAAFTEEARETIIPGLLQAIDQWQRIQPINSDQIDYDNLFNAYQISIKNNLNGAEQADNLLLLDRLISTFGDLPETPSCLTHHDLHIGNLCGDQAQLTVLDWEYAGFGNPWFDAACLSHKFNVRLSTIGALPAFQHLSQQALSQGMTNAIELIKVLETLWFAVRSDHTHKAEK